MTTRRRINHIADVRAAVWDACEGKCYHCGKELHPFRDFQLDHLTPLASGGADVIENLVGSCAACNRARGITIPRKRARVVARAPGRENRVIGVSGKALRNIRVMRGMTQRELAGAARSTHAAVSQIELGKRQPRPALIVRFATALKIDPRELMPQTAEAAAPER